MLERILITPGHIDHASGAAELAERNGVPIEGPQDETPWFHTLCPGAVPAVIDGHAALPTARGLGITLDLDGDHVMCGPLYPVGLS